MADAKIIGKCPLCGGDIVERSKSWSCGNWKKDDPNSCSFTIWKVTSGTTIEEEDAIALLTSGETQEKTFTSRAGKPFTSKLIVGKENHRVCFSFQDEKMEIKAPSTVESEVEYEEFIPEDADEGPDDLPF